MTALQYLTSPDGKNLLKSVFTQLPDKDAADLNGKLNELKTSLNFDSTNADAFFNLIDAKSKQSAVVDALDKAAKNTPALAKDIGQLKGNIDALTKDIALKGDKYKFDNDANPVFESIEAAAKEARQEKASAVVKSTATPAPQQPAAKTAQATPAPAPQPAAPTQPIIPAPTQVAAAPQPTPVQPAPAPKITQAPAAAQGPAVLASAPAQTAAPAAITKPEITKPTQTSNLAINPKPVERSPAREAATAHPGHITQHSHASTSHTRIAHLDHTDSEVVKPPKIDQIHSSALAGIASTFKNAGATIAHSFSHAEHSHDHLTRRDVLNEIDGINGKKDRHITPDETRQALKDPKLNRDIQAVHLRTDVTYATIDGPGAAPHANNGSAHHHTGPVRT